jgi:hypothetical protein
MKAHLPMKAHLIVAALLTCLIGGCASVPRPRFANQDAKQPSPLGPSYVLLPLPSDDDTLLGRVLPGPPEAGRALEEVARPNPCEQHLTPTKESALASTFEDAQELSGGASAGAILGTFGFQGDVAHATHFVYRLNTSKRMSRTDTTEYLECCKEQDCGFGFVTALIQGDGEYSTGEETSAGAKVNVAFASAEGRTRLRVLHKRKVSGYIAAVLRVTDTKEAQKLTPFGYSAELGITEETLSDIVKPTYERAKISVETEGSSYLFKDGTGETVTENEFVRRYRAVTGSDEVDDVEHRRNWGWFGSTLAITGLGAAGAIAGGIMLGTAQSGDEEPGAVVLSIGGTVMVLAGIPTIILSTEWASDGSADDHELTELDARILAAEHNRTLLRRAVQKAQRKQARSKPSIQVSPRIGLGSLGLIGTF